MTSRCLPRRLSGRVWLSSRAGKIFDRGDVSPLLTTDAPGCGKTVGDGVDGLLVPVRDADALADAIARLQDDPGLARRLGEAARAKALSEFDERIVIARTLGVYRELLS